VNAYQWLLTYLGPVLGGLLGLISLLALLLWLQARRLRSLEQRYRTLITGTEGGNLEVVLNAHVREVRATTGQVNELDLLTRRLERDARSYLQRVGFVRFNPFRDAGGDQSFALVLADEAGRGVVISSLHSRDATRIYGKPLAAWQSPYQLTAEERQAIEQAKAALH
jgi:hypothetical protein